MNNTKKYPDIIDALLQSSNPVVIYKTKKLLLDKNPDSPKMIKLRKEIRKSEMAQRMIRPYDEDVSRVAFAYKKWQGPHWTLVSLAQIDYPTNDNNLFFFRDQIYNWFLHERHMRFPHSHVFPGQENRRRHCASIEGNAIWSSILLGIDNDTTKKFVHQLVSWQWPDGGWNCDKRPEARTSSVIETCIPMRALYLAGKHFKNKKAIAAANKAAEYFLSRNLFRRRKDGKMITKYFDKIQYPIQFYDVLYVLMVMAEMGKIKDPRCKEALDLLQSKQLTNGGFPLEMRNAKTSDTFITNGTFADWGVSGKTRMNELVTVNALWVLKMAGRL